MACCQFKEKHLRSPTRQEVLFAALISNSHLSKTKNAASRAASATCSFYDAYGS